MTADRRTLAERVAKWNGLRRSEARADRWEIGQTSMSDDELLASERYAWRSWCALVDEFDLYDAADLVFSQHRIAAALGTKYTEAEAVHRARLAGEVG